MRRRSGRLLPGAGLRARRWDVLVLGSALPGLAAAVRLGMAGLRVALVEEQAAAETAACLREPFSLTAGRSGGVVHAALLQLGVPLIERRSLVAEEVAHQVLLPEARLDAGGPELCAAEWVAWGLLKPEAAREQARQLEQVGRASAEALAERSLLRRGARGNRARLPELATDAPAPLAPVFRAQQGALSNLAGAPPPQAAARLLGSVLEGGAYFERPGLGLASALGRRFQALHGERRQLAGPFELIEMGGHPGVARGGEAWLGRALLLNAPAAKLAATLRGFGHDPPGWLTGPEPSARRAALAFEMPRHAVPEGLARRAIQVPATGPAVEWVQYPGTGDETRTLVARARVAESDAGLAEGRAAIQAAAAALLPFSADGLAPLAEAARPLWDDELVLVDPEPGTGFPAEIETRAGRGASGIHRLARERVAALGVEGDLLLGLQLGQALAAELV